MQIGFGKKVSPMNLKYESVKAKVQSKRLIPKSGPPKKREETKQIKSETL